MTMTTTTKLNELAVLRTTKGYSIRGLAKAAKLNPVTITRIEKGRKVSLLTLGKLATALGVDINELLALWEGTVTTR